MHERYYVQKKPSLSILPTMTNITIKTFQERHGEQIKNECENGNLKHTKSDISRNSEKNK